MVFFLSPMVFVLLQRAAVAHEVSPLKALLKRPLLSFDGGAEQWAWDVDELRIEYGRRVFAMDAMD